MLYLDEDVAAVLAPMLLARGYPTTTTFAEGRMGSTDGEQLEHATRRGFVLVTHNVADFASLAARYAADGRHHAGMILCLRRPPRELADRICAALHGARDAPREDLVVFAWLRRARHARRCRANTPCPHRYVRTCPRRSRPAKARARPRAWREQIGIEPTRRLVADAPVLKTGGPTRYPAAPAG